LSGDGPGRVAATELERAVHTQRGPVLDAAARGAAARRRRTARESHGRRPRRRLHGPHSHLPGASGKTQGSARGLGRVQLSQGHRTLQLRCAFHVLLPVLVIFISPYNGSKRRRKITYLKLNYVDNYRYGNISDNT